MKVIKYYLFFTVLFISSPCVYSQYFHGVSLGTNYNIADFKMNESVDPSGKLGFSLGYFAEQQLNDNLYTRFGVTFNKRAFNAVNRRGINTTDEKWAVDVFEIPINLGYYLNWNNKSGLQFFIDAGANLGYNSRATVRNKTETIRLDIGSNGDVKRFTTGVNGSLGVLYKKRIKVRLNYYTTLSSIVNSSENVWKNQTIGISLNYFLKDSEVY